MPHGGDDTRRPPREGERRVSARYFAQEHRRTRRQAIIATPPLFARETDAGTILGLRGSRLFLARTTSTITAATYSSGNITAFGSGTADLYDAAITSADPPVRSAAVNDEKSLTVYSVGTATIASGTTVLLGELFGDSFGLFVLGKVC